MGKRNNRLLVPEARPQVNALKQKVMAEKFGANGDPDQVKYEVANEVGVPLRNGYNGDIQAKQAGKIGGTIGGSMVKEMVKMAQQAMIEKNDQHKKTPVFP